MRYHCTKNGNRWCALQRQADPPRNGTSAHVLCADFVTVQHELRVPTCELCKSMLPPQPKTRKARPL